MDPRVSLIVPVYNSQKYLSMCLASLVKQTYNNIEIVVINDGSTDRSETIIKHFMRRYNNINYIYQENQGSSVARNKGLANVTGEYLMFVDSDDTVDKNYVKSLLEKQLESGADLVCSGYCDISEYGKKHHNDFDFNNNPSLNSFMEMVFAGTGGVLWAKIFKREIILKNKLIMNKNIFMSEDLLFVLRYATHCKSFASVKKYLYNYNRLNQLSISTNITLKYLYNQIGVCKEIEEILHSIGFDEERIQSIIANRIQVIVLQLAERQSGKFRVIGLRKTTNIINEILSINYIKKYIKYFSSQQMFYIPYVFLLKKNHIKISVFYGYFLSALRKIKKAKIRKQVSL